MTCALEKRKSWEFLEIIAIYEELASRHSARIVIQGILRH
jgi:hypothetical protein